MECMVEQRRSAAFAAPTIIEDDESHYRVDIGSRKGAVLVFHRVDEPGCGELTTRTVAMVTGEDTTIVVDQRFVQLGGALHASDYLASTYNGDRMVTREEAHFRDARHLAFGGKVTSFPSGMMPVVAALTMFRGMDLTPGRKRVSLWLGFSLHWPVDVRVEPPTVRKVGPNHVEVIPLKARPSLARINGVLDSAAAGLLPDVEILLEAAPTHRVVSMSFPTGPFPWDVRGYLELELE